MQVTPQPPEVRSADVDIIVPAGGNLAEQVGHDGLVAVIVRRPNNSTATSYTARIIPENDPIPAPSATDVSLIPLGGPYFGGTVPAGPVPLTAPATANKRVVVWPNAGDRDSKLFIAHARATISDVQLEAKQSIWFAYAPPGYISQTTYNEAGDTYRPAAFPVPTDATKVTVTVTSATTVKWWHGDSTVAAYQSDGSGTAVSNDLDVATYRDSSLNSQNIRGMSMPYTKLVGMWGRSLNDVGLTTGDATKLNTEFAIGRSLVNQTIGTNAAGERALFLFLGCHDSREWSNNGGWLRVKVEWST